MHRWNIFLIKVLSMLASPQIKTVKPPDKKPGISDRSSLLRRRSVKIQFLLAKTVLQHSPGRAASKAYWLMWFIRKTPKILRVFTQDMPYGLLMVVLWKRTFYRNDDLSTTCHCRQLKLNSLWTQINILSNDWSNACWYNALHEHELQYMMLLQSLHFSHPSP